MEDSEFSQTNKRKATKTSVACTACKSRKTKCSGGPPPCNACEKLNTRCVIDPGSDMRRRGRDHYKAYRALLEAFAASIRKGDLELSRSLYRTIELTDASGKLAEVAQCFSQAHSEGPSAGNKSWSPTVSLQIDSNSSNTESLSEWLADTSGAATVADPASSLYNIQAYSQHEASSLVGSNSVWPGMSTSRSALDATHVSPQAQSQNSNIQQQHLRFVRLMPYSLTLNDQPIQTYDQLLAFWSTFQRDTELSHPRRLDIDGFGYDTNLITSTDNVATMVMEFRHQARQAICSGVSVHDVLGSCVPTLDAYFDPVIDRPVRSVWEFACNFCAMIPGLSIPLRLTIIYLIGLQMRFLTYPSRETFNDLPPMLRPLQQQYTKPHPASIDLCHVLILRHFLLDHWPQYRTILMDSVCSQSCNWPYSDAACFGISDHAIATLSAAFIEHVTSPDNYSISAQIIERLPMLASYVQT